MGVNERRQIEIAAGNLAEELVNALGKEGLAGLFVGSQRLASALAAFGHAIADDVVRQIEEI